jgi:hypothetical protein
MLSASLDMVRPLCCKHLLCCCTNPTATGGQIFYGTLDDAKVHFAELGFQAPEDETPTDFYLQVRGVQSNCQHSSSSLLSPL